MLLQSQSEGEKKPSWRQHGNADGNDLLRWSSEFGMGISTHFCFFPQHQAMAESRTCGLLFFLLLASLRYVPTVKEKYNIDYEGWAL